MLVAGVVESWRASRSSKPVAGRSAGRGGFDSHPLPPSSLRRNLVKMDAYTFPIEMNDLVDRVFIIESITQGTPGQNYLVKYKGRLRSEDSATAYEILRDALKPKGMMPLFRMEGEQQVVEIVKGLPEPRRANPWLNLALFILTICSVLITMALNDVDPLPPEPLAWIKEVIARGWPFAASLLSILSAHEMGHYIAARLHRTRVTLPYFLPFPVGIGTLGAFINMQEPPRNRRVLLDIALAGPLAGLAVALPILFYGLSLSTKGPILIDPKAAGDIWLEGNSIFYLLAKYLHFGQLLPSPISYDGVSPLLYWIKFFFIGKPFPIGGQDVYLHPVAFAGWFGLLVTALNLIPAGQLDGGHLVYLLLGREKSKRLLPIVLIFTAVMGVLWMGWWIWTLIIFFLGRFYVEPPDLITPLNPARKILAILGILIFILVIVPVPAILLS